MSECKEYSRCYHIMCVSDILTDWGMEFDCYEDMWEQSNDIYDNWVEWDIKNEMENKMPWIESFNEYLKLQTKAVQNMEKGEI